PGSGVNSATVTFVFDLSVEVVTLDFPKAVEVLDAFVITVSQKDDDSGASGQTRQSEEASVTERIVWLKVLRPTGETVATKPAITRDDLVYSPLPSGEFRVLRVVEEVPLNEEVLDNLPKLVFEKLPDGQYQIWLQEPGEQDKRFVMDVTIRDGRPADDKAGGRDRPPTSLKKVQSGEPAAEDGAGTGSTKDDAKEAPKETDRKVSALGNTGSTDVIAPVDDADQAWSRWGRLFQESHQHSSEPVGFVAGLRISDTSSQAEDESSLEVSPKGGDATGSLAMIHPMAVSAILAAGSVLSKRKQNNWEDRVDDMMAQWEKRHHAKKN
ncbi:MAG: hypothetical protein HQ518_16640, partial [Rhodopirellula sp.]|nr:hypothetical protein [Rhodopirellula sp.]